MPGGTQSLNRDANQASFNTSMTVIGGVPYISWREFDGTNYEVRVSRLNAAGNGWEPVGESLSPASPINRSSIRGSFDTSITSVGGVPYVAFNEQDAGNVAQLRVSRLNAQGSGWEPVGEATDPVSPINHDPAQLAVRIDIEEIGGVPHVAWRESFGAPAVSKIRVSRLSADGLSWTEVVGGDTPVNRSATQGGDYPSLASVGGVPHVSWAECDAGNCTGNNETRVARYDSGTNTWMEIAGSPSPINQSSDGQSQGTRLTSIGGVPYVAWNEHDGTKAEMHVARPNASATAWDKVGQAADPVSPINAGGTSPNAELSLTSIGGVPYVAWVECSIPCSGPHLLRVARLNDAGTAWDEVVGGPAPINFASTTRARYPSLSSVGGVPYVAWEESCPGCGSDELRTRAARLEPDFLGQSETVGDAGATLTTSVRTFGVPYPIAFEYGPGTGFGSATATTTVQTSNTGSAPVTQPIGGLAPGTYSWRAIGTDGVRTTGASSLRSFAIRDALAPTLSASLTNRRFRVARRGTPLAARRAPRGTRFRYRLSEPAKLAIAIEKCRTRRCTRYRRRGALTRTGQTGANSVRFSGRLGRKALKPGRYRARLRATDAAGNASQRRTLTFTVVP
jgi:hypothetical protein